MNSKYFLDNVAAITCFIMAFNHYCNFDQNTTEKINIWGLFLALICQEADPWNI